MVNEYEAQANKFLKNFNLTLKATFKGEKCPPWDDEKHIHGDQYRITIKRSNRQSISFDFWNSLKDKQDGIEPTAYDVLAAISGDANMPTNPDDVADEIGEVKPSQAIAIAKFAKRLQAFFTSDELEKLAEIQ